MKYHTLAELARMDAADAALDAADLTRKRADLAAAVAADSVLALISSRGFLIERGLRMGALASDREANDTRNPVVLAAIAATAAAEYRELADALATFRAACDLANTANQEPTR